jgi:hypothetical protein
MDTKRLVKRDTVRNRRTFAVWCDHPNLAKRAETVRKGPHTRGHNAIVVGDQYAELSHSTLHPHAGLMNRQLLGE